MIISPACCSSVLLWSNVDGFTDSISRVSFVLVTQLFLHLVEFRWPMLCCCLVHKTHLCGHEQHGFQFIFLFLFLSSLFLVSRCDFIFKEISVPKANWESVFALAIWRNPLMDSSEWRLFRGNFWSHKSSALTYLANDQIIYPVVSEPHPPHFCPALTLSIC